MNFKLFRCEHKENFTGKHSSDSYIHNHKSGANEVYGQKRAKREKWECRVQVAYQAMLARIEPFFLAEFDRMSQFSSLILSCLVEATATVLFFVI